MGIVVVLGSLIADLVAQAPRLPYPGESLIGNSFQTFLGGKGINQAIAASRMGAEVTLVGRVGNDNYGEGFFPILAEEGIDSAYIERDEQSGTGVSLVVIATDSGQNMIVANPRANLAVSAEVVERALSAAQQATWREETPGIFLSQCETSQISYLTGLRRAHELGMTTILNAAPVPPEGLSAEVYPLVDILIVNEVEAAAFSDMKVTNEESARKAAAQLLQRGPQHIIVTLGAQGSLWARGGEEQIKYQFVPAFKVKAVDATAAGDTFCGALAASLAAGSQIEQALRRASAAGAITASRMGAIAALPTSEQVDALLKQNSQ